MISREEFVRQSLELHLFFGRIMKEHSFFLQLGFTPDDSNYIEQADVFRREFDRLLSEVISFSSGVVSEEVLKSGEVITKYTLNAEMASAYYTGVQIPTDLTKLEADLMFGKDKSYNPMLEQRVFYINQKAIDLISGLIHFKELIITNVLSCKMYTTNYPLLLDHILREAKLYRKMVIRLQEKEEIDVDQELMEQELFWNRIMAEHSKFIRGLLDPTEEELIKTADNFGNEFDQLTEESKSAMDMTMKLSQVTEDSLKATEAIRDFKEAGTKGILSCKIKSIIIPLLGDHTLREANHYLRLLNIFSK